jgi:hypothetical protein
VRGFGVGALSRAQAPRCTRAGGAWCPCLSTDGFKVIR